MYIDVKVSFTRKLNIPDLFFKKRYLFITFNLNDKHRQKKGNNFAFCSTESEYRNFVFLLVLTSRIELFIKKYNCRNLSLIAIDSEAMRARGKIVLVKSN